MTSFAKRMERFRWPGAPHERTPTVRTLLPTVRRGQLGQVLGSLSSPTVRVLVVRRELEMKISIHYEGGKILLQWITEESNGAFSVETDERIERACEQVHPDCF